MCLCVLVCVLSSFWRCICHLSANFSSNYTLQRYNDKCCLLPPSPAPFPVAVQLRFVFMQIVQALIDRQAHKSWPSSVPVGGTSGGGAVRHEQARGALKLETDRFDWPGHPPSPSQARGWLRSFCSKFVYGKATAHAPSRHCEKLLYKK